MSEPEKKRPKLEISEPPIQGDSLLQQILEYKHNQLKLVSNLYESSHSELFYLENEGDILSFPVWCKNPNSSLDSYLSSKALPVVTEPKIPKVEPVGTPVPLRIPPKVPGSSGPGRPSLQSPEQLAERARHEAVVMQRIAELQRDGLWTEKRLPKVAEPQRLKSHWDYLLEEVQWLAADFVQERKWKTASARKCARMVQKYFQDKEQAALKAEKEQEQKLRKIASFVAKEIRLFWGNVEKLSEYKQNLLLEEKRKQMLNQHLNLIVQQTEEFSSQLAETMQGKPPDTPPPSKRESDIEFEPEEGSTDDEETIEKEEKDFDVLHVAEEIDNLKKESEIPLEDLLGSLPPDYFDTKVPTPVSSDEESDAEFEANETSDDDEATLNEQEENEGDVADHRTEIAELEAEQNLPIEELLQKYGHKPVLEDMEVQVESGEESGEEVSDSESKLVDEIHDEMEESDVKKDDVGLEALLGLDDSDENAKERRNKLSEAAELAETFQPKGNTLASAEINVQVPFLLKGTLREYQMIGLNWLATMYERQLNGILADEMGLGKTIQTISLLAWLACEKGIWGPHLIIVPTSVMLNWEMECKKWCPALKVLTYYGSRNERKIKRTGWTKRNAFHICITSYKLVVQDHGAFRRKQWQYIILDEAQNIKNFKSQRWQLLLNFQSQRRLLLTGTPLQNNLMELWSLMHFLMPSMFSSHKDFREWFSNPVTGMIEGNTEYNEGIIKRLHKVLRPFLLRRLKSEVEKQLPSKYEHVVMCRLSKRQRYLYDDYMSRAKTRETLSAGNLLSVINVLMQLRKVCAHPNLFEPRPTISPFQMEGIVFSTASCVVNCLDYDPFKHVNLGALNLLLTELESCLTAFAAHRFKRSQAPVTIIQGLDNLPPLPPRCPAGKIKLVVKPQQPTGQSVMVPRPGITGYRPVQPSQPLGVRITTPQPLLASTAPILPSPPIVSPGGAGLTARQPVIPPSVGPPRTNGHLLQIAPNAAQPSNGEQRSVVGNPAPVGSLPNTPIRIVTTLNRQPQSSDMPLPDDKSKVHVNGEEKLTAPSRPYVDTALLYDKISLTRGNSLEQQKRAERKERLMFLAKLNKNKCDACPAYGQDLVSHVTASASANRPCPSLHYTDQPWTVSSFVNVQNAIALRGMNPKGFWSRTRKLEEIVKTPEDLMAELNDLIARYAFVVPPAMAPNVKLHASHIPPARLWEEQRRDFILRNELQKPATILHTPASAMVTQFPDPRLIQYDCGKLQVLDRLLRDLKVGKHRVLIFTQMTRMLDVLESFLTFHGHTYLRLDGATKIDQRQALMERFNSDKRIFCFILSTRSGGIGVNLTGADTVVFYDSDWNPTMDAQAQDRCHRIGQTRDVHIYRLISEKTIEENILKKANQKRLLGDLAIEGGNFTTAYFKNQTIRDLFDVDVSEADVAKRLAPQRQVMSVSTAEITSQQVPETTDKVAVSAWESALQAAEDETDVVAAKNLRAEVAAEMTEFDENGIGDEDEPKSKAEIEMQGIISQLTPVERYALRFIETDTRVADQLAQAEEEMEERKRQWEIGRAEAAKKASLKEEITTYPRVEQDLYDQLGDLMPTWAPPTPPHGDDEYYFDHSLALLYRPTFIPENLLPPLEPMKEVKAPTKVVASLPLEESVVVKDEAKNRVPKVRKDEVVSAPRSLFERPNPALTKLKRDLKLARIGARPVLSAQFGGNIGGLGHIRSDEADQLPEWQVHEDMALLNAVQNIQGLPLNLQVFTPALSPNWDLVADMVNVSSVTYRSPKECKVRYFNVIVPREEGRFLPGDISPKKFKKHKLVVKVNQNLKSNRGVRTAALFQMDNNQSFTSQYNKKYEILKSVANRRAPTTRPLLSASGTNRNPKHAQLFQENGVFYDGPMSALQIAANKAERLAKEKARAQSAAELAASAAPARAASLQPSPQQSPSLQPTAQQQTIAVPQVAAATPKPQGNSVVVSVANLTPAQVQAAAQLIAGLNTISTSKAGTTTVSARSLTPAQLQLLRAKRLQTATVAQTTAATTTTTYVAVQPTGTSGTQRVVTLPGTQGKQHLVLTKPGQGVTRAIVADPEVAALLKRQQALQAQKMANQNQVVIADASASTSGTQPQSFLTQVGSPGTPGGQLGSLLKTQNVPASSLSGATLTIPVSALSTVSQIPQVRSQTVGLVRASTIGASPRQITIQQPFVQNKRPQMARTQSAQSAGIRNSTSSIQLGVQFPQGAQRVPVTMLQQVVRGPRVTLQPRSGQQPVRQTIQLVAAPSLRPVAPNVTVDQSGRFATSAATTIRTSAPTLQAVVGSKPQTSSVAPITQEIRLTIPPAQKPDDPGTGGT